MSSSLKQIKRSTRDVTLNIRAHQHQRDLIDRAAAIVDKSRSDFILEAACQKAEEVLLDRRVFNLPNDQWQAFLAILDAPIQPNQELRDLLNTSAPWDR